MLTKSLSDCQCFYRLSHGPGSEVSLQPSTSSRTAFLSRPNHEASRRPRQYNVTRAVRQDDGSNEGGERPSTRISAVAEESVAFLNGADIKLVDEAGSNDELVSGWPGVEDPPASGYLTLNGFVFREHFVVRCYEVGINRSATIETMANLMQEVGTNHASSVGFSKDGFATTHLMRERRMIWVTTKMHIELDAYPLWGEIVELDTWFQEQGRMGARRDWIVRDARSGKKLGQATSKWVAMNQDTRRLARTDEDVRSEYAMFCPDPPMHAPVDTTAASAKIQSIGENPEYRFRNLQARRSDLDMNHHVNNVCYIGWMLESIPEWFIEQYDLRSISLEYRRECIGDDVVESCTSVEPGSPVPINLASDDNAPTEGAERVSFIHLLRLQTDPKVEMCRGRTTWSRKLACGVAGSH